jgi:hypothetical protein
MCAGEPFVADGGAFVAQELLRFQEKKDEQARQSFEKVAATLGRPVEWRTCRAPTTSAPT